MKKLILSMVAAGLLMAGSAIAGPDSGEKTKVNCKDKITDADIIKEAEEFCKGSKDPNCVENKKKELQKKKGAS